MVAVTPPEPATSPPPEPQPPGDTDPPETEIDKAPKNRIEKPKAKYKFSSDEAGCKHKFQVAAIDRRGTSIPRRTRTSSSASGELAE